MRALWEFDSSITVGMAVFVTHLIAILIAPYVCLTAERAALLGFAVVDSFSVVGG